MRRVRFFYQGRVHLAGLEDEYAVTTGGLRIPAGEIETWLPPIQPNHMYVAALNYKGIFEDLELEKPITEPVFFQKFNTTAVGHSAAVFCPPSASDGLQCEAELLAVIGRPCRHVPPEQALEYVSGYLIGNDVAIPHLITRQHARPPFRAKQHDTFGPMGPWFVDRQELPDPHNLTIKTYINNQLLQSSNTCEMVYSIPELIASLSTYLTLCPGDIIWSGTPRGCVLAKPGDIMAVEIQGLGRLENKVTGGDPP